MYNPFDNYIFTFLLTLNPFLVKVSILYLLKTPENQRFFGVFRGYKMGILARDRLNKYFPKPKLVIQ